MAQLIRRRDWSSTMMGTLDGWSTHLKSLIATMLDSSMPICVMWGPTHVMLYNDAFGALLGDRHPWGLGRSAQSVEPQIWPFVLPVYERVLAGETLTFHDELVSIERNGRHEDGWFTLSYSPVRDATGRVGGIMLIAYEVTERLRAELAIRQSEARHAFLLAFHDTLRPLADTNIVQATAARLLAEQLDCDRAYYSVADVLRDDIVIQEDHARRPDTSLAATYVMSDWPGVFGRLRAGQTVVVRDARTDTLLSDAEKTASAQMQTHAFLAVPLMKDGQMVATMVAADNRPRDWSDDDVATVTQVAQRTHDAMERTQTQIALAASEERMRMAMDVTRVGHWDLDLATRDLVACDHCKANFGRSPADRFTIDDMMASIHPDESARVLAAFNQAIASGGPYDVECRIIRPDGATVRVRMRGRTAIRNNCPARMFGVSAEVAGGQR